MARLTRWQRMAHKLSRALPGLCYLCGRYHADAHAICNHCQEWIEPLGPACQYCAMPLPNDQLLVCGPCCVTRPIIDKVITAYRFSEPLRTLIHAFKYQSALQLGSILSALMLDAITHPYQSQCLIPVPLHPKRLQERGFNQAAILALTLSRHLHIPCDLYRCTKILATRPQTELSAALRRQNLENAFAIQAVPYQHVTLVDDLYTTGATAKALATLLKQQGVARVDLWCCARTC